MIKEILNLVLQNITRNIYMSNTKRKRFQQQFTRIRISLISYSPLFLNLWIFMSSSQRNYSFLSNQNFTQVKTLSTRFHFFCLTVRYVSSLRCFSFVLFFVFWAEIIIGQSSSNCTQKFLLFEMVTIIMLVFFHAGAHLIALNYSYYERRNRFNINIIPILLNVYIFLFSNVLLFRLIKLYSV